MACLDSVQYWSVVIALVLTATGHAVAWIQFSIGQCDRSCTDRYWSVQWLGFSSVLVSVIALVLTDTGQYSGLDFVQFWSV